MASTPKKSKTTKKKQSLKAGRPPASASLSKPTTLSSRYTQKTIVTFHTLNKDLQKAQDQHDDALAARITAEIDRLGGLKAYQAASIQGQAVDRGGDSSSVLLQWLTAAQRAALATIPKASGGEKLQMLEVGALSTKNACSRSALFDITRIDLHSQAPGIQQQDFMARPLPGSDAQRFDMISLSLVLNFVPSAAGRGEMLRRTTLFLRRRPEPAGPENSSSPDFSSLHATLFLVLPAPCVRNSRYLTEERLTLLMASLGYVLAQRRLTAKLVYYLWQLRDAPEPRSQDFPKTLVREGGAMNNFCVVLEREAG